MKVNGVLRDGGIKVDLHAVQEGLRKTDEVAKNFIPCLYVCGCSGRSLRLAEYSKPPGRLLICIPIPKTPLTPRDDWGAKTSVQIIYLL